MAASAALASAGFQVTLFESRPFLGGRASSFPLPPSEGASETIDNCQHVLLRCCVNLLDFYRRLGVADRIHFHKEFLFIEPGGRVSALKLGWLPAPLRLAGSFLRLPFLSIPAKLAIASALAAIRRDSEKRADLDRITMLDWLRQKNQPSGAIARFWRPILVSAVNEELHRMAAAHGLQVFRLSLLAGGNRYEMGVPAAPLSELYAMDGLSRMHQLDIRFRSPIDRIRFSGDAVSSVECRQEAQQADYYVCALPFDRLSAVAPELGLDLDAFQPSPITGIHLWFDRPVTELAQAALLDRTIQWCFNKKEGRYLQLVVSASHSLMEMSRGQIIEMALGELAEFLPRVREAVLEKAHVVKEPRATFAPLPGLGALRPPCETAFGNLFLAGDWTRSGWPATMEGAVRSGYLAAEAVTRAAGSPRQFVIPDRP
jgi:squalene-associated FAD-dependent desaturase